MGDYDHGVGAGVMDYCEAGFFREGGNTFQRRQGAIRGSPAQNCIREKGRE